ncbi:pantoate--beta-alanine ligase [Acetonema longum]|uniref:Pantothenate synthetase n=1 Tax=Acetonema longum DSM 6540 TaxID=1009370 RepID=F7NFU1_9FIRM|nr:pantoate--beta-alanine ligase [Acetonema longum]EGO65087.1 pantoate--beta-alanine ligase [Acetonema longum DSM 6540]
MHIMESVPAMKQYVKDNRRLGKKIGFVPTMGALHEGHLTLMRQGKKDCDVVIASIFVNPVQFGPNEDFDRYPRDLQGDSEKAARAGVDAIFHPSAREMYPEGYATYVNVEGMTEKLCGSSRPGHFRGVTTVVLKLLNIVQPDKAYFGQKDAQQALVLKRMAQDLNLNAAIEIVPIVRENDGLALSSRNMYLSPQERQAALILYRSLCRAEKLVAGGEYDSKAIREAVLAVLEQEPLAELDYAEIYHYPSLQDMERLEDKALLALAVRIGKTRLIDNIILEVSQC